jgi:dTMP kinase
MFVTFEGVDGSGKSTQAKLLVEWLEAAGHSVLLTREPGGTPVGEAVRKLVLDGDEMTAWTEATLFASARAEHVARAIRPALAAGRHVVCDRYLDSSVAYQGIARGLGEEKVRDLSLTVTDGLLPERTFLLLVDAADALARSPDVRDRIEREDVGFMSRVDAAYRSLAEAEPERIVALDGQRTPDDLQEEIREHVRALL